MAKDKYGLGHHDGCNQRKEWYCRACGSLTCDCQMCCSENATELVVRREWELVPEEGQDWFTHPDRCRSTYGEPGNGELDCLLRKDHVHAGVPHWAEVDW